MWLQQVAVATFDWRLRLMLGFIFSWQLKKFTGGTFQQCFDYL